MFENYSARQLAAVLRTVPTFDPNLTGALSILDEAALRWTFAHPELTGAHAVFAAARHGMWPTQVTPDSWPRMTTSALALADDLEPYGDEVLNLCGKPSQFGDCRGVIKNGTCLMSEWHTEGETK